ncbi:Leucine-rich repeat extensin-like protein 6 [Ranunculus cassubicifolius]
MRIQFKSVLLVLFFVSYISSSYQEVYLPSPNPRLLKAYEALQAWKHAIISDPKNVTSNWYGPDVCKYKGVFCAKAPDDPHVTTVAGIDLNHAKISGYLPEALGLLCDLSFFHINTNHFCGTIPESFKNFRLLNELDVSNNNLTGLFPQVVLHLPKLKYLDIRFNGYHGDIPTKLWGLKLDAIFVNSNKFQFRLPSNIGSSPASVLVMANTNLSGCFPASIAKLGSSIEEIILSNSGLTGCLPPEIGKLTSLTVFDVSSNKLVGSLPETIGNMKKLEILNVAKNKLSGEIPASICSLKKLKKFRFSNNYFCSEPEICLKSPKKISDKKNCIPYRPYQRSAMECEAFLSHPISCEATGCAAVRSPSPPPSLPPH